MDEEGTLLAQVQTETARLAEGEILLDQLATLIVAVEKGKPLKVGTRNMPEPFTLVLEGEAQTLVLAGLWRRLQELEAKMGTIDVAGLLAHRKNQVQADIERAKQAKRAARVVARAEHERVDDHRARGEKMVAAQARLRNRRTS